MRIDTPHWRRLRARRFAFSREWLLLFAWLTIVLPAEARSDSDGVVPQLVVKYRSEGPHALDDCAERITTSGGEFQSHTRDRSPSLDLLFRQYGLGKQRALFRRATSRPFEQQRRTLRGRWAASVREHPRGKRSARPSPDGFPDLAHIYRVSVPKGVDANELAAQLNADPHVAYAQTSHIMDLDDAFVPNDPFFHSVGSWGQSFRDLWGPDRIRAPEVWSRSKGEGMVVAVVDTGLDAEHPDIAANVWVNPGEDLDGDGLAEPSDRNGVDDDGNGFVDDLTGFDFANSIDADEDGFYDGPEDSSDADPFDDNGHGSHVAGTIAAVADNGIGIVGIAPRAKLMALKGFRAQGSASDIVLWRAVLYAAEMGATVINNSWSCGTPCPENPLADDVLSLVDALGTVVVTSAGNAATDVVFRAPESGSDVITVGALGVDDGLAGFSNRGWLMDVVAPGGSPNPPYSIRFARRNILSLLSSGALPFREAFAVGGEYLRFAGTSMSSPHVAGAVALLRSLRPELSPGDVRRLIRISSQDLGPMGHDPYFGAGVLDVARLVDMELPDLALSIDAPGPGTLHDPRSGALLLMGRAEGRDLASFEIGVGSGLVARTFVPIEAFGESGARSSAGSEWEEGVLARWDTSNVPDGPYVLRLRARLHDGRAIDEFTVIGIERNTPIRLSPGERSATRPSLSGRQIIWQVKEPEAQENGIVNHDLAIGGFPDLRGGRPSKVPESKTLVELEGEQRNPISAGREIAWEEPEGSVTTLARCRVQAGSKRCERSSVSNDPGRYSRMQLGRDWLVWTRLDEGVNRIEGCRIGPSVSACSPRPIMAPEAGDGWILNSFDGDTLFVRRGGAEQARCRLSAVDGLCRPEAFSFGEKAANPVRVVHDGNLVAFQVSDLENRLPPGCIEVDPEIDCVSGFTPVVRVFACWLNEGDSGCQPIALTPNVPLASLVGMDVSGRRVTWSLSEGADRSAIHFCEFVSEIQACSVQRLGGALPAQRFPSIDSDRIVWEDERLGEVGIFGIELPRLDSPTTLKTRPGRPFWTSILGLPGSSSEVLRFEVEGIEGLSPEDANARIVPLGVHSNLALLTGRAPRSAMGKARWKLRAIGEGGLFTERVVEISFDTLRGPSTAERRSR